MNERLPTIIRMFFPLPIRHPSSENKAVKRLLLLAGQNLGVVKNAAVLVSQAHRNPPHGAPKGHRVPSSPL